MYVLTSFFFCSSWSGFGDELVCTDCVPVQSGCDTLNPSIVDKRLLLWIPNSVQVKPNEGNTGSESAASYAYQAHLDERIEQLEEKIVGVSDEIVKQGRDSDSRMDKIKDGLKSGMDEMKDGLEARMDELEKRVEGRLSEILELLKVALSI